MEYEQPESFELPIQVDCFDGPPVELGKKILIVGGGYHGRGLPTLATIMATAMSAGIPTEVVDFAGDQPRIMSGAKPHVRHQGEKERLRRLKRLAKRQAT